MLKELGQIASLLKAAPKLKEEMAKLQARLGQISAEGDAGGGMVKVRTNGRMEIIQCAISEDAFKLGDRELLEDLIRSAANHALEKARQAVSEETSKVAGAMGMPSMPNLTELTGG